MKSITWKQIGIFVFVALIIFIADRYIKEFMLRFYETDIILIPDFFRITFQTNPGIAFSIRLPYILQLFLFPTLLVFGMLAVIKYLKFDKLFVLITIGAIVGGALSNYVDRLLHREVIDYISIWIYPVFNLSDLFITVGIFLIIVFYGKIKRV